MRFIFCGLVFASLCLPGAAQTKTFTPDEIDRFASLGRLWGMLHYFHPQVLNGNVVTDSLIVPAARSLAADASAANYKQVVARMLAATADADTRLISPPSSEPVKLLTAPQQAKVHMLPGGYQYIALPTDIDGEAELAKTGLMDDSWKKANGLILDLRKADYQSQPWTDEQFSADMLPTLRNALMGSKRLPSLQERNAAHNGFLSQTQFTPNVYSSGWRTNTLAEGYKGNGKAWGKPVVLVLHAQSSAELKWQCLRLAQAGVCEVVIDGEANNAGAGRTTAINLSDGLLCQIRLSDVYTSSGHVLPKPATVLPSADTTLTGAWVQQCLNLLRSQQAGKPATALQSLPMDYVYPRPARYSHTFYPEAGLRLMGLYNWWNAIQYFFPYKHLTNTPWDSVLLKHIPAMLTVKDSVEYALAIRSMVSDINDSHGFLNNENKVTPIRKVYGYWPPIQLATIQGKIYVVEVGKDSTQDLSVVKKWDEVTAIDGVPVLQAAEKWRTYIASSNESTYFRDVVNSLPNGPQGSTLQLKLLRQGIPIEVSLKRSGRENLRNKDIDFNDNYATLQKMQDSVLYINMGNLTYSQADSLGKRLNEHKVLLFDLRNYPQGTAWTLAPHMTTTLRKAVLFDRPFVTPSHIFGGEDKANLSSHFTVMPADRNKAFRGRVFILCNEQTQSQAEYTIMMFQGATNCTVVGSQTAGADGNVTQVAIPGGYEAWFSGLGILYPDGGQTQRKGIRVDVEVKPTIAGLIAGRDEVLEAAMKLITK